MGDETGKLNVYRNRKKMKKRKIKLNWKKNFKLFSFPFTNGHFVTSTLYASPRRLLWGFNLFSVETRAAPSEAFLGNAKWVAVLLIQTNDLGLPQCSLQTSGDGYSSDTVSWLCVFGSQFPSNQLVFRENALKKTWERTEEFDLLQRFRSLDRVH